MDEQGEVPEPTSTNTIIAIIVMLGLLLIGIVLSLPGGNGMTEGRTSESVSTATVPTMDARAPEHTEIATFALG